MNFCCVTTFVTCGFEHSIANMTFLSIGLMNQNGVAGITMGGFWLSSCHCNTRKYGGRYQLFVATPYYLISGIKEKSKEWLHERRFGSETDDGYS